MRSIESDKLQALWMRWVCSMYSEILWRKLSGSLNTTGIAILDSSCKKKKIKIKNNQKNSADKRAGTYRNELHTRSDSKCDAEYFTPNKSSMILFNAYATIMPFNCRRKDKNMCFIFSVFWCSFKLWWLQKKNAICSREKSKDFSHD